jgi:hypothetical protein
MIKELRLRVPECTGDPEDESTKLTRVNLHAG